MACFRPLDAFYAKSKFTEKGMVRFKYPVGSNLPWEAIKLPCGQCIGCRLDYSRQWAVRCVHEASLWEANSFLTLTYADDQLPPGGSLYYPDFQLFMKRFRSALGRAGRPGVRFYMCGEYGENLGRPHYHCLMFNWWPHDARFYQKNTNGDVLYTSEFLSRVWGHGYAVVGGVTFESAAYVARYILKKIKGDAADEHYETDFYDSATGEVFNRVPEFTNQSRRPGIAAGWIEKWKGDVYPQDLVVLDGGRKMRPPRFYDRKFELAMPREFELIKAKRKISLEKMKDELTEARLRAREKVVEARVGLYRRELGK